MAFNWTCPYCNRPQTPTDRQTYSHDQPIINNDSKLGRIGLRIFSIRCANPDCLEMEMTVSMFRRNMAGDFTGGRLQRWQLLPESNAKPLPDFVPAPIRQDYTEACRIRDLSPKASATLSRRCLQGMIRDFCGISRSRLIDEIKELRQSVDEGCAPRNVMEDSVDAIDHTRSIGNIGAHMERDINVIVDVDPGEAQALIDLLELLLDEWYVEREKRRQKLVAIGAISAEKKEAKKAPAPEAAPAPQEPPKS